MSTESKKTIDMNDLNHELGHRLENITLARGMAMGLKVTDTFQVFEAYIIGETKKTGVSQSAV